MGDMWVLPLMNDAIVLNHVSEPSAEEILYLPSHFLLLHTYSTTKVIEVHYPGFSEVENWHFKTTRAGIWTQDTLTQNMLTLHLLMLGHPLF